MASTDETLWDRVYRDAMRSGARAFCSTPFGSVDHVHDKYLRCYIRHLSVRSLLEAVALMHIAQMQYKVPGARLELCALELDPMTFAQAQCMCGWADVTLIPY